MPPRPDGMAGDRKNGWVWMGKMRGTWMKHDENTALAYDFVHECIDSDGVFFNVLMCGTVF